MRDNLRLYTTTLCHMRKLLPTERITRLRNLTLMMTGLFLAGNESAPATGHTLVRGFDDLLRSRATTG